MPRTNQGVFKNLLNRNCALVSEYADVMKAYQSRVNRDFFEGLAQRSEKLYGDMDTFIRECTGMLKSCVPVTPH